MQSQTQILARSKMAVLVKMTVLITLATTAPLIGTLVGQQAVTGPIVNATLFISILILSRKQSILVALIPSLISVGVGLLPAILFPMIPFIMIGNILLMLLFDKLKKWGYFKAVFISAVGKFMLISLSSIFVTHILIESNVSNSVIYMMSYPQLITALIGGLLAYFVLIGLKVPINHIKNNK